MSETEAYDLALIAAIQGLLANSGLVTALPISGTLQTNILTAAQAIASAVSIASQVG